MVYDNFDGGFFNPKKMGVTVRHHKQRVSFKSELANPFDLKNQDSDYDLGLIEKKNHFGILHYKNWGCPADLLTNQTVLNSKVHGHTSRAPPVGIEPTSPPTQAVALPTKPQIL